MTKLRVIVRTALIVCVVLLCAGFGVYSYFRLNAVENRREFDLYSLVPQDAVAVFETDRMAALVDDINKLKCSRDNHFLYASELFVYLKDYLHTLVDDTPHGFSRQMNKMLLSFHEPDTPMNQVLYCALGDGDFELVESLMEKYCSSAFPSKMFDYKGEEIRIYPLSTGSFVAVYVTRDFLAISFQKRLIEQVVDAYQKKRSLLHDAVFRDMHAGKRNYVDATLYLRMKEVDMGKSTDGMRLQSCLGGWMEFDMKLDEEVIYCAGIHHGVDSVPAFVNALRSQLPIEGFDNDKLPGSTFFYNNWAISNRKAILSFTAHQGYAKATYSDYIRERDEELYALLNEFATERAMSCLFLPKDSLDTLPCAVLRVPLSDERVAERRLRALLHRVPAEHDAPERPAFAPRYDTYPLARGFRQYLLPRNTLLTQLTGITESELHTYACFYRGSLLLAPDARSLSAYIDALERGAVVQEMPLFEEAASSLPSAYNYLMLLDMESMLCQPESYVRLVPKFFFRQAKFFRHFLFAFQFVCTDGVVYPNVVLIYKDRENKE